MTEKLLKAYKKLYSGVVYDALHQDMKYKHEFVLETEIKSLFNLKEPVVGYAFTCKGRKIRNSKQIDDNVRLEAFSRVEKDNVMIYETQDKTVAHFGDITARIVQKRGCVGVIIPGYTRDIELIERIGLPVFCYGTNPIDAYGKWQITEYKIPIKIGDVTINQSDIIFADGSGILVIRNTDKLRVLELAEKRLKNENRMRDVLKRNKINLDRMYGDIGRW